MSLTEFEALFVLKEIHKLCDQCENKIGDQNKPTPTEEIKQCQNEINKYIDGIVGEPEEEKVSDFQHTIENTSKEMIQELKKIQEDWVDDQEKFRNFLERNDSLKVEISENMQKLQIQQNQTLYEMVQNKSQVISKIQNNFDKGIQNFMQEMKNNLIKIFKAIKDDYEIILNQIQPKLKNHIMYPNEKYEGQHKEWPKEEGLEIIENTKDFKLKSINYYFSPNSCFTSFQLKFSDGIESPVFGTTDPYYQPNQEIQIGDHIKIEFYYDQYKFCGIVFYDKDDQETQIGMKVCNMFEINLEEGEVWVGAKAVDDVHMHLNPITLKVKEQTDSS